MKNIDQFGAHLLGEGKSERTVKAYRYVVERFERWLIAAGGDLGALTRFDVQSYVKHLEAKAVSPATIGSSFAAISAFAKFMDRADVLDNVRIPEVRKTRNIASKSLERTERNRLLREVERAGNLRDTSIVWTLLHTGLRVSELVALNVDDLTLKERSGWLIVRSGKGGVSRKVPLSAEIRLHLSRYLETRKDNDPALFLSHFRQRISVRAVQHMLAGYGVHPHQLRHTFARELVSGGVDIATVAELAGHQDINVTRRYAMPTEADLAKAIEGAFC